MLEVLALTLLFVAAVPATAFPIVYAWIARGIWWRVPAGRALITSSTALAVLLDLEIVFLFAPISPVAETVLAVVVLALIAAGAYLKLGALLHEHRQQRRSVPPTR